MSPFIGGGALIHSYSKRYPPLTLKRLKRLKRFKRFQRFQTPLFQNPKIQENRGGTFKIKAKVKRERITH